MFNNALAAQSLPSQVHKFGGSSLADGSRFNAVADIVLTQDLARPLWVVVSAPADTTDALLQIIASSEDISARDALLTALFQQLSGLVHQTLASDAAAKITSLLQRWFAEVPDKLAQQQINDVLAIGELLSAILLAALLRQRQHEAVAIDAREFLRLSKHQPDWLQSRQLLQPLINAGGIHVITGYIGRDDKGRSITLGRNGSDYSATILAALVEAADVTIWTDVNAIYSADPRKVSSAVPYREVSWQQACRLAQLGNPVLHARTLSPLTGRATALKVRSSYESAHSGCQVSQQSCQQQGFITELSQVSLLTLHADSVIDANDLALELQQPVVPVSRQGDNQSWLLPTVSAEKALSWLAERDVHAVWDTQSCHAVAWLKGQSGNSAAATSLLQSLQVLHCFDSTEQTIWLLEKPLTAEQLQQLHQLLIQAKPVLQVVVAGVGNVGTEFLTMLKTQQQRFSATLDIQLAGVLNSRHAVLQPLTASDWQQQLAAGNAWNNEQLQAYLAALPSPKVLVDITPSQTFALHYPAFIAAGCHIISANKQGVTLASADYNQIIAALAEQQKFWLSNTTCGAGIPVQRTLQELMEAGDDIKEVSGIFSGTLSWLLCKYDGQKAFSDFVLEAQQAGLTEPDPRDDLSGKDVQRKLLVLARELGLALELDDIVLEPLLPAGLAQGDWAAFWSQRDVLDKQLHQQFEQAKRQQKVLRYVASLQISASGISASVALQQVALDHALAAISPCDNVFVIRSDWYGDNPLVLKGPGAGRVVTAGGLHADLAQLITRLYGSAVSVG